MKTQPIQGLGFDPDDMSLAMWVIPAFVRSFVEFQKSRSGGVYNHGSESIYRLAIQLVQKERGFLRRRPDLLHQLPREMVEKLKRSYGLRAETDAQLWEALCDLALTHYQSYSKGVRMRVAARPSKQLEHLDPILRLPRPDVVLVEIHRQAERRIASLASAEQQRRTFMDLVVSRLLMETGLRVMHFPLMRYSPYDSSAQLKRDAGNKFRLEIPVGEFKNWNSAVFKSYPGEDPRSKIQVFTLDDHEVQRDLAIYVDQILPHLLRHHSHDFVFPVVTTGAEPKEGYISARIRKFTARCLKTSDAPEVIKQVGHLGLHSYRHIFATTLAKLHGLHAAALFLLDTLEVVQRTYAHYIPSEHHEEAASALRVGREEVAF